MVAQRRVRGLFGHTGAGVNKSDGCSEKIWGDSFLKSHEAKVLKEDLGKLQLRLSDTSMQLCADLSAGDLEAASRLQELRINGMSIVNVGLHASWKNAKHFCVPPDWRSIQVAPIEGHFRFHTAPSTSVPSALVDQLHAVASAARTIESILAAAPVKTIEAGNKHAFGLGTVRQLSEYEAFCGVSFGGGRPATDEKITSHAHNGGLEASKAGVAYCLRDSKLHHAT